jgi:hypothetical protein
MRAPARLALLSVALVAALSARASDPEEQPVKRTYLTAPPAPTEQSAVQAQAKSAGCRSCHTASDQASMHARPGVVLGCSDCHGGDPEVAWSGDERGAAYDAARDRAHVLPRYPGAWNFPKSANPERSYALLNKEAPEFVRFVNPGDYRIAREACGACHLATIQAAERSLMATSAMFWGGAAYNNGLLPYKRYVLGEGYTREGKAAVIEGPPLDPAEAPAALGESRPGRRVSRVRAWRAHRG